jgi:3-hydroxyacyl-CoA dehydrogenase
MIILMAGPGQVSAASALPVLQMLAALKTTSVVAHFFSSDISVPFIEGVSGANTD